MARDEVIGHKRRFLAALLSVELETYVDPSNLWPATGYWRTDHRADVYRWEGSLPLGYGGRFTPVGSWETMTELCRTGVDVNLKTKEIHCCSDPVKGKEQRRKARESLKP